MASERSDLPQNGGVRILITGAAGLVGGVMASRAERDHAVAALRHRELDITDDDAVNQAVDAFRPTLIVNCAVVGVDDCERDPLLARRINVDAPTTLARAAKRHDASFVHFSTNYVFDGERRDGHFYVEDDEARPINVYGLTKLSGEQSVQAEWSRSLIVRTSWVYGPGKESFLATAPQRLQRGERISAIDDVIASTTYVEDLVDRVDELVRLSASGVFHVTNSGACSYAEFAEHATRALGLGKDGVERLIQRRSRDDVQLAAPRPRWTPMACSRSAELALPPLRSWQAALDEYISRS